MPAATASGRKTRKTPNRANGRGLTEYFNSSASEDSSNHLQVQFLTAHFGVSAVRASLVADLFWGTHNG